MVHKNELPLDFKCWRMVWEAYQLDLERLKHATSITITRRNDLGVKVDYDIDLEYLKARCFDELWEMLPTRADLNMTGLEDIINRHDPVFGRRMWKRLIAISKTTYHE